MTGNYGYESEGTQCYVYDSDRSSIIPSFEVNPSIEKFPKLFGSPSNEPVVIYDKWILFAFIGLLMTNVVCLMAYFCKNEIVGNKKGYKVVKYEGSETENDQCV